MAEELTVRLKLDRSQYEREQSNAIASARRGSVALAAPFVLEAARMGKAFVDAGQQAGSAMAVASGEASALNSTVSALPSALQKVVSGIQAFDAVVTVWKAFNSALEDTEARMARLTKLGNLSRDLGVSPGFLQSFVAQAGALGVAADKLEAMLAKAREAGTVRIGEGKDAVNESAIQARLRQNVMAGNLTQADTTGYNIAITQEAKIKAVLDLIEKLRSEQKNLAANDLGKTFFGENFEAQARAGIDVVGAMRRGLEGLKTAGGAIITDPEEIVRAQKMADQQREIADIIANAIRPAVQDFNYLSDLGKQAWIDWERKVASWVEWLGQGYLRLRDIVSQARQLAVDWGLISAQPDGGEGSPLVVRVKPRKAGGGGDRSNPLPSLKAAARTPKDAQDPDSVANVIRQLEKARDVAEAELRTVGLIGVERERAVGLAKAEAAARADVEKGNRANAALTAEETQRIIQASEALGRAKMAQMDLEQQLRNTAETARFFGASFTDALSDAALEGRKLGDVLVSLEKMLGRAALQALFMGQGPLASLFGTAPLASQGPNALGGVLGMAASAFGFGSGKVASSAAEPIVDAAGALWFHEGGRVGDAAAPRVAAPTALFGNARRFHAGLASSEFPAILQYGERVLTEAQDRSNSRTMSGLASAVAGQPRAADMMRQPMALQVDVSGARGNSEIMDMVRQGVAQGLGAYDRQLDQTVHTKVDMARANFGVRG